MGTAALAAAGLRALASLPIDAVPDLTNVQVQVLTAAPSLGPLDIERLVTAPVELSMGGLPHLREVRSTTRYGGSAVTVVFEDGVDPFFARQLVGERLARVRAQIPATYGVPELGPMSTGLGEIYQFEVRGDGLGPMALRGILDWDIAPRLRMVPGVVEVNTFGGELQTYEVAVDPGLLVAAQVSMQQLFDALEQNNRSAGGGAVQRGPEGLLVRGDALVRSLADIGDIVVAERGGVPVYVRELGQVRLAPMLRQGAASRDGRGEIVAGMAMMLAGENSRAVARGVQAAVDAINGSLPPGVRIEPFYDRTALVQQTLRTVSRSLLEGGVLVIGVLLLMLRNARAGLIAAAVIPLSMLAAFIGMRATGVSGNLMSLGALDFGLVVDGAIILLENAVHHVDQARARLGRALDAAERDAVVLQAALEVRSATAFGELIIAVVYLPILALQGVEAKMFHPMALTVLFALLGAFVLSLTFVPALAASLLSGARPQRPSAVLQAAAKVYAPALRATLRRPGRSVAAALAVAALGLLAASRLGSEFVPRLDEGAIVVEASRLPSTSLEESVRWAGIIETALAAMPEVATVVVKTGRPEIANDLMGVEQSDVFVILRPRGEWPQALAPEALVQRLAVTLQDVAPGAGYSFSQPIEMRSNELLSGVRADFAVKIYGDDLATLARLGAQVTRLLGHVDGAVDIKADRVQGLPVLRAVVDRTAAGRLGATAGDVLDAIAIVGGRDAGVVFEGRRRFALRVRLAPPYRDDLEALARLPIRTAGHGFARLGDVARLQVEDEPVVLSREATERRLVVQANVRGRDLGSFAAAAQARLGRLHLPPGYHLSFGGQFENLQHARARLGLVVPLALGLICALLYGTFRRPAPVALILGNVPLAATGGALALWARGLPLSISAAVGFIALFGVATLNGLVLVSHMLALSAQGLPPHQAAAEGASRRLRPVLTTALVASLGFLPMALARGAGAEVQRPLATVVMGGLVSATLLTLLVLPTAYAWLAGRTAARAAAA